MGTFSRHAVLNVAMLLRDSVVARQVRTYLLDVERDGRPQPVDNALRARVDIDPTALDEHIARIGAESASRVIGRTIVPMLNHLIRASGEQHRELIGIREDLERVKRAIREREVSGTMTAVDTMGRREFVGAAKEEYGAEVALFVTSATFTPAALDLAARHGITAVHRALLEAWSTGTVLQVLR